MERFNLKYRLLLGILVIGSIITLGVSLYQLRELQAGEVALAEREIADFKQTTLTPLRQALWNYDWSMIEVIVSSQANSILTFIEVCDAEGNNCVVNGRKEQTHVLRLDQPILYKSLNNAPRTVIGHIRMDARYQSFSRLLETRFLTLFATNGLLVFGIAISVFMLFHLRAIRRLEILEQYTRNIDLSKVEKMPSLAYAVDKKNRDEVDMLALAVTDLTQRIQQEFERRKQLEQRLIQTEKMEALGTLAGGIAHDFNNILAAILGYTQLCLKNAEPDSKAYNRLDQIKLAGQRAQALIAQILVFSRKSEQSSDAFCLAAVVVEALDLVYAALPKQVTIESELDENLWIAGDDSQLHQVVMNLATNAVFVLREQGGTLAVSVALEALDQEQAEPLGLEAGEWVCLTMRDNGPGIDAGIRERIFEPFFTTKKNNQGTGMGLAVVHGIALSHGGCIVLDDAYQQGACFKLYFPSAEKGILMVDRDETLAGSHGEHLLVVDDEEVILNMGQEMLESLGYDVTVCLSPDDVLPKLAERDDIDLLITDLTMPEMSGLDLAEQVRKRYPHLPILLWSGYASGKGQRSIDNGVLTGQLHKPFTLHALSQAVADCFKSQ